MLGDDWVIYKNVSLSVTCVRKTSSWNVRAWMAEYVRAWMAGYDRDWVGL